MPTLEELVAIQLSGIMEEVRSYGDRRIEPMHDELERLKASVSEVLVLQRDLSRERLGGDGRRLTVRGGAYDGLSALDLAVVRSLYGAQRRYDAGYAPASLQTWGDNLQAAMDSTTAGSGDELVDTQQARELWMDVNLEASVAPLFARVDMPSNPFEIPLQLGDVNWYPGVENVASKSTNLKTGRQTLTAFELVAEVPWSYDLDEDAVISMMEEFRTSLVRNASEIIDDVLLNGDTSVTDNINADGATIATTDAGKAQWLIGFDGLIHLALIDNATQAVDNAGAVSDDMFNLIRLKLAKYAVRPSDAVYIVDINTWIRSQFVSNLRTLDKFGPQATLLTGQLGAVEGIPVIVSEQMKLADTDGKITDGGNGTDTGRLLLTNRAQWRVGFRREMSIETVRDPQKRQNIMVVSFRIAFQERSGDRTTATHTALRFNINPVV